jgi:hypothetical protein
MASVSDATIRCSRVADARKVVTFPTVTTSQFRVVFTPQPGKYVGVTELESWYPRM